MKLHVQNQLYTSFSFWDLNVLIASLGMPDHAHLKLHHQFVALIDIYLDAKNQLYIKNPAISLAEGIFAFNSRTGFFPDMWF